MIRLAGEEDIEDIREIYRPYVEKTTVSFEWELPSREEFMARFQRITKEFPWLVYDINGKTAGYAYSERVFERTAYQWSVDMAVYIHPDYHNRGAGRKLYHALEELLKLQGYINVYALVTKQNHASVAFHKAEGYTEVAGFPHAGFKMGQWLEVIWFQKTLLECPISPQPPKGIKEIDLKKVGEILKVHSDYEQQENL